MEVSLNLISSIAVMFIMILAGYILAKTKVIKIEEADVLSKIVLYTACPAAIINSFAIEVTQENMIGFLISILAGALIHAVFIILSEIFGRTFHLSAVEKASMIYPNCGNLVIPLVTMVLGKEMVIYCSGCLIVNTILLWTHGRYLVSGEKGFSPKKLLTNVNMIAIAVGIVIFLCGIQLPSILSNAVSNMSSTLAPLSMFVVGIILSGADMKSVFMNKKAYVVCLFRLIVYPVIVMLIFVGTGMIHMTANAASILMITMLAASAPSASTIAQFASIYHRDTQQASIINVMSVMLCIITMPLISILYTALAGL